MTPQDAKKAIELHKEMQQLNKILDSEMGRGVYPNNPDYQVVTFGMQGEWQPIGLMLSHNFVIAEINRQFELKLTQLRDLGVEFDPEAKL